MFGGVWRWLEGGLVACTASAKVILSALCIVCWLEFPDKLLIWGCFECHGTGSIVVLPRNTSVTADWYTEVLNENLEYSFEKTGCDRLMDDGAPCHRAKKMLKWMEDNNVKSFGKEWPANSPDLNPTRNLWGIIKRKLEDHYTSTICQAGKRDSWHLQHLAESASRRLAAYLNS